MRQGLPTECFNHNMHMIWHNTPSEEPIALTIKIQKSVFHHCGNTLVAQPARAVSLVQSLADALFTFCLLSLVRQMCQLYRPSLKNVPGQRVGESEGDELHEFGVVNVRQIATMKPLFWTRPART